MASKRFKALFNLGVHLRQGIHHPRVFGLRDHVILNHVGDLAVHVRIRNKNVRLVASVEVHVPQPPFGGGIVDLLDQIRDDALPVFRPDVRRDLVGLAVGDAVKSDDDAGACAQPRSFHRVGSGARHDSIVRGDLVLARLQQLTYSVQGRRDMRWRLSRDLLSFGGRLGNGDLRHTLLARLDQVGLVLRRLSSGFAATLGGSVLADGSSRCPGKEKSEEKSQELHIELAGGNNMRWQCVVISRSQPESEETKKKGKEDIPTKDMEQEEVRR